MLQIGIGQIGCFSGEFESIMGQIMKLLISMFDFIRRILDFGLGKLRKKKLLSTCLKICKQTA